MIDQWSELPGDLLDVIEGHLFLYPDKVRVRAVCASWNSQLPKLPNQQLRKLPWLLLQGNGIEEEASHALFDPFENKFYHLDLPEAQGKLFKGSSHGWVVTIEDITSNSPADIYLINPLTTAQIPLPARSTFPDVKEYHPNKVSEEYALFYKDGVGSYSTDVDHVIVLLRKVVLSSTPSSEDCVVVAIYGEFARLAFCKCNDERWTSIDIPSPYPTTFADIAFYEQKLYAVNGHGQLVMIENIGPNPKVTGIVMNTPSFSFGYPYLAKSCDGDLIVVSRFFDWGDDDDDDDDSSFVETCDLSLYKPNFSSSTWVEVENLREDEMLFLGISSSMSISSRDFPGLKGNCIYYTDSPVSFECTRKPGDLDTGVFRFDEEMFDDIPGLKCDPKLLLWPPPVWLMPASPLSLLINRSS